MVDIGFADGHRGHEPLAHHLPPQQPGEHEIAEALGRHTGPGERIEKLLARQVGAAGELGLAFDTAA